MYYKTKHFTLQELVSPKVYRMMGEQAWILLDPRLLMTIDKIQEKWGTMYINTWKWGGQYEQRGLRSEVDIGRLRRDRIWRPFSQHVAGRAVDCHFKNYQVKTVREYILNHPNEFPEIRGVEIANWLHIDVRNAPQVVIYSA